MRDDIDAELLARVLAGEGTEADTEAVRQWAGANPAHARELEVLRLGMVSGARTFARPWRVGEMWSAVERTMQPQRSRSGHGDARFPRTWPRGVGGSGRLLHARRLAVGATTMVVVVVVLLTPRRFGLIRHERQPVREFATAAGGRATVSLRDGTRLTLGPSSRLRVPPDFGARTRTVELDGQAYFAVVHDAAHPLTVRTAHATVRDVGTVFTVAAYADDPDERIAVSEGEVILGATSLRTNDLATVDAGGHIRVRHNVDVTPYVAWTQGHLVFHDTPLRDAARDLGRAFDLDISIADSTLAMRPLTAAFGRDPIDEVLDVVTHAVGARYERVGRRVVIRRRGALAGQDGPAVRAPMATAQLTPGL